MSQSSLLRRLLGEVGSVPVIASRTPHATALGTAICASVGAGLFKNLAAGARALAGQGKSYTPEQKTQKSYRLLYRNWRKWHATTSEANTIASDVALEAATTAASAHEHVGQKADVRPRLLVTASMDEDSLRALRELGDVTYSSYRAEMRLLAGEELVEALQGYDVFVTETDVMDADVIEKLPDLKVVFSCRGNPVNIDVAACTAFGIPVLYTPGRNAEAVADLTVAFLLSLMRKLSATNHFLRVNGNGGGDLARMGAAHVQFRGNELWRRTVGLVGLGRVGRQVIKRLQPFRPRSLVHDPHVDADDASLSGAEMVSLSGLLAESDAVTLHARVTEESRGIIGADQIAQMKRGAFLINTARAALVDESALISAMESGHLGGAALDVFTVEPPAADHPLLAFPNVIATPHVGGNTCEVAAHQGAMVVDDLSRLLHGQRPSHVLNEEVVSCLDWKAPRAKPTPEMLAGLRAAEKPTVCDFVIEPGSPDNGREEIPSNKWKETVARLSRWRPSLRGRRENGRDAGETVSDTGSTHATRRNMERVLQNFVSRANSDEALRSFAHGKDITVHYTLTDVELSFFTSFDHGTVRAGLGASPSRPEVALAMKAEILDGIFTDRINGTKAALTGKLAFTGDTIKAISLKRVQSDLNRLYQAAREKVGVPDRFWRSGGGRVRGILAARRGAALAVSLRTAAGHP